MKHVVVDPQPVEQVDAGPEATRSTRTTSRSLLVWRQPLQSVPSTAPGITWANAQVRLPALIASGSTSAGSG
jgi:hypothetical protein